ncbi:MAG: hypothetical protein WCG07_02335 [Candidatus Taylorbacteria bacterium]
MATFESGVLDRTRIVSNILMLLLVAGNIFFSIQYTQNLIQSQDRTDQAIAQDNVRIQNARLLKLFIDVVLNTKTISLEDRIKLENDMRQTHDADTIKLWDVYSTSKDGKSAQIAAVNLMVALANKML